MKKKRKRPKAKLILSHVNHTFFILDPWIGPQAFKHTHCTIGNNVSLNVEESLIQCSIWFKLVLGLLVFGSLFKVALRIHLSSLIISTITSRNWAHLFRKIETTLCLSYINMFKGSKYTTIWRANSLSQKKKM
jgi:hypothetical protein